MEGWVKMKYVHHESFGQIRKLLLLEMKICIVCGIADYCPLLEMKICIVYGIADYCPFNGRLG